MNKILLPILAVAMILGSYKYHGSTTSAVTIVGGIVKAQHVDSVKKYKRKDCPICKGKGYYISGDGIEKVNCGYCIPDKKEESKTNTSPKEYPKVIIHPPLTIQQNCPDGICPIPKK